jgi:plastocyanin
VTWIPRIGAAGLLAIWLAACGTAASPTPVATDHVDLPKSYRFEPEVITVSAGTTVTWTNSDQFTHSVRLVDDGGAVLQMAPGESVSFTFETVGTHRYDCSFHAQDMKGSVIVTEASAP